ncbi:MAG: aminotransferase class IV [Pseudomonadota bacterium]
MTHGTHDALEDPRNAEVKIYVNGELVPRDEAKVSVFDSGFMLGDGVWEGLRLHNGKFAFMDEHLDRLFEGAKAIDMDIGMSPGEMAQALYRTTEANGMDSGVHVRLMVTRGPKKTPFQDPRLSLWGPTIVIIPEHKTANPEAFERGIRLFTAHIHRGPPDVQDPKLNSHSKLNCIIAMIQAIKAECDEALMLDPHGFVATCNSTNFFIIRKGEVWTSTGDYCMNGITRGKVVALCRAHDIPVYERNFSVADVYGADEAFVTGTFGGLTPVVEVDGRTISEGPGPETRTLRDLYLALMESECPSEPGS